MCTVFNRCSSASYKAPVSNHNTTPDWLESVSDFNYCVTGTQRHDHITPVLHELHWLPIRERVKFKVACLVSQLLSRQAPVYLADDCCLVSDSTLRSLRSADVQTSEVPRTKSSYGDRTFQLLNLVCGTLYRSNCAIQTSPSHFTHLQHFTLLNHPTFQS